MRLGLISAIFATVAMIASLRIAEARTAAPEAQGLVGLLHASPDRVKARLGDPAIARAEGKGAFWTYRAPRCALYIFFKEEGGALKVSGAAAGPRKRGVAYADLDVCLGELEQSQAGAGAPVRSKAMRLPRWSDLAWILVEKPPRERPSAWPS